MSAQQFRSKYKDAALTGITVETSQPAQEPVLQAADYVLWSVQRAFERGEMRYFEFLRERIELVWDIYDVAKYKGKESNVYDRRKNPFDIKKATPLG